MEQRSLLVVGSSPEDRARVVSQIQRDAESEYRVLEAGTIAEGIAAIGEVAPDCAVIDEVLADGGALDFFRAACDENGHLPFPAIILTETGDREAAVALMKAGAFDYLVKSNVASDTIRLAVNSAIYQAHAEQHLLDQRRELERLYAEASATNDALRAANAAKDDFLAMLSHELRTPLTPVLSLVSSTMSDTALTPDLRETFSMIQRNVELEARLIDDLLDLTQIASGRLRIEKSPVDVHRCVEAALDVCHEGFAEKRISIRTELAAADSTVMGEFARLNQVFWNVLKNAVKFGKPNGQVTITTANESADLVVEIQDDGMGIEPGRLASIFGAFGPIRPQPTATGLGLGLAITRAIVEGHGGEIRAGSSGKGCGSVFRISLPVSSNSAAAPQSAPQTGSVSVRGKTILVVEDHDDTRRVLSRALRRRGFGVTAAGSVAAASAQFASSRADLIICDIGLPDGSGWDLMEELRPHGPVRAIAVSGFGMEQDVKRSREVGFIAHLTKPIDFTRLETLIIESLADEQRPSNLSTVSSTSRSSG